MADLERIASVVIDAAYHIHSKLGPGLLESVYHTVLSRDLVRRGLFVESKKSKNVFNYYGGDIVREISVFAS